MSERQRPQLTDFLLGQAGSGGIIQAQGQDAPSFYGVPEGYTRPWGGPSSNVRGMERQSPAPRYAKGTGQGRLIGLSDEAVTQLQYDLQSVGLIGPKQKFRRGDPTDAVTLAAFEELLGVANATGYDFESTIAYLKSKPLGMFDEDGNYVLGGGSGGGPTTSKQRSKSVNLTDPTSARALLRNTLRRKLGRAPKPEEYQAFVAALNAAEQKNPSVSEATVTTDGQGNTTSSSTSSGGLSAEAFADEYSQQGAIGVEANTFMVATDYYQAAMQALDSPVDI